MSYYKEKRKAKNHADNILNKVLYEDKKTILVNKIIMYEDPKFDCDFMKIFFERLKVFIALDDKIIYDKEKQEIRYEV